MRLGIFGSTIISEDSPKIKVDDKNYVSLILESTEFKPLRISFLQLETFLKVIEHDIMLKLMRRLDQ